MEVRRLSQPQYWASQFVCTLVLDLILLWSYLSPSYTINSCCLKIMFKSIFHLLFSGRWAGEGSRSSYFYLTLILLQSNSTKSNINLPWILLFTLHESYICPSQPQYWTSQSYCSLGLHLILLWSYFLTSILLESYIYLTLILLWSYFNQALETSVCLCPL